MNPVSTPAFLVIFLVVCPVSCQPPTQTSDSAKQEYIPLYLQSLYDAQKRKISGQSEVFCQWQDSLAFEWLCDYVKEFYQERGQFDSSANVLSGIDIFKNEIYTTIYRTSEKVPAGLNKVVTKNGTSLLQPYPSLARNELGKCTNLQYPIATKIDPKTGYLYVIDIGSTRPFPLSPPDSSSTAPNQTCPPKLVVLDINNKGALVRSHDLDSAVTKNTNYLKNLVLDFGDRNSTQVKYAYITDSGNQRLIVFSFTSNTTWFFQHESMKYEDGQTFTANGTSHNITVSINGIALDQDFKYVYYSALGSRQLSQIPTSVLRDPQANFTKSHRYVGNKMSQSDGMVCGKKGLYYGAVNMSAVYRWNIAQDMEEQNATEANVRVNNQTQILKEATGDYWIDSVKLDDQGYVWFTARALSSDTKGSRYKIYRVFVNDKDVLAGN